MFNSSTRRDSAPAAPATNGGKRGVFSVLAADVTVTGNIAAASDLHIDGRVEGDVTCAALVQGSESVIVGSVKAESARLAGGIEGSVQVRQLHVERSARITGDVEYESLQIEPGAKVDGKLRHNSAIGSPAAATNVTAIAKPADGEDQQRLLG